MATGLFRPTTSACRPSRPHDIRPSNRCASSAPTCAQKVQTRATETHFRSASNPTSPSLVVNKTSDAAQRTSTAHSVSGTSRNAKPRPGSVCCGSACRLVVVSVNRGFVSRWEGNGGGLMEGLGCRGKTYCLRQRDMSFPRLKIDQRGSSAIRISYFHLNAIPPD